MDPRVREIEEAVVDAWPASDTEELDGWLLRASGGPTRRGNSVATLDAGRQLELDERIARAEAFYQARGKPPAFQVGPCARPRELDQALAARGYVVDGEAIACVAEASAVLARATPAWVCDTERHPGTTWLEITRESSRFAASYDIFLGFLQRLGSRARYVTARDESGRAAATCLTISSEQRLGLYAMLTVPEARRRGAALSLLYRCAEDASARGLGELYLLVEAENEAARSLYARVGFTDLYRYHYRVREGG